MISKIRTLAPESREMLFAQTDNRFRAHNIADPATIPGEPEAIEAEDRRAKLAVAALGMLPWVLAIAGAHFIRIWETMP